MQRPAKSRNRFTSVFRRRMPFVGRRRGGHEQACHEDGFDADGPVERFDSAFWPQTICRLGRRLREQLRIDDARNRPQSVLTLHADQSRRLELDDRAVHIADNKLTHEAFQKRKVPDDHLRAICGGE
jgi:hypothetical protein